MLLLGRSTIAIIAACLAITCTACQSKTARKPAEEKKKPIAVAPIVDAEPIEQPASPPVAKTEHKPAADKPKPLPPPPPPAIPKVALSNELRATCLVNVGDTMPKAKLPDLTGKMHALDSLYGEKLTLVCVWTIGTTHRGREALHDMMKEVAEPFGQKGVRVIGINVGGAPEAVAKEVSAAGATFPNLSDPKGDYFAKIAKGKRMPRTFLLDAAGRVLWFDVESSRPSRRELLLCIRAALGEL